jgi:hypothetical protein
MIVNPINASWNHKTWRFSAWVLVNRFIYSPFLVLQFTKIEDVFHTSLVQLSQ